MRNFNSNGKIKNKVGFNESEILDRRRDGARVTGFVPVHCLNPDAHKNGDADASAYYNINNGFYGCNVCDLRGFADDRDRDDYKERKKIYEYSDGHRVFRDDRKEGRKRFSQSPRSSRPGGKPKPYGWEGVTDRTKTVLIVEGEKAVDYLQSRLDAATVVVTSRGGCKSAAQTDWSAVKERVEAGARVEFLPDRDEPGEKYVLSVAQILGLQEMRVRRYGGDRDDGFDIADLIEQGGDPLKDFEFSVEKVARPARTASAGGVLSIGELRHWGESKPLEWLVPGLLPRAKLVLLFGRSGIGKSTIALRLAACLSTGRPPVVCMKGKDLLDVSRNILIYSGEDDWEDTLLPRLQLMGADRNYIAPLRSLTRGPAFNFNWDDPAEVEELHRQVAKYEIDLLIIDPGIDIIGSRNNNDPTAIRAAIEEKLSPSELGCTILLVHHERKDTRMHDLLVDRAMGSQAWTALARVVIYAQAFPKHLARDRPEVLEKNLSTNGPIFGIMIVAKCNIAKQGEAWHYEMSIEQLVDTNHVVVELHPEKIEGVSPEMLSHRYSPLARTEHVSAVEEKAEYELQTKMCALDRATQVLRKLFVEPGTTYKSTKLKKLVREGANVGSRNAEQAISKFCISTRSEDGYFVCSPKPETEVSERDEAT